METSIGLDIGSSAVRAAEIVIEKNQRKLRHFGQVGLPPGAVVDGEVVNPTVVSEALRRLWAEGGFSSTKVILGVSGHRLIVRQADMPALNKEDLRSALRFDAQELIPIPMEDATFDFQILGTEGSAGDDGRTNMRILIAAAHKELLRGHMVALKSAGLEAVAIDPSPLALMRVVPPTGPDGGVEALVSIGAELTTVAVREGGTPRFIRSLAVGGSKLTSGIANGMHVDLGVAESLKRGFAPTGAPQLAQARKAMSTELRDLGEDVRATMDFFVSQADGSRIERLLITGGASLTEGLVESLAGGMDVQMLRVDPFAGLVIGDLGFDEAQLGRARATAATAIGLALWTGAPADSKLSLLPSELAQARQNRRTAVLAGVGVGALVGVLALVGAGEAFAVHSERNQVHSAQTQAAVLQAQVDKLTAETAVHGKLLSRRAMVKSALQGDVDWVRVLAEVNAAKPAGLNLQSFTGARPVVTSTTSATSGATSQVGTVTFAVTGTGGLPAAAAWLDGLEHDPSLQGTWLPGITVDSAGNQVTFTSNSNLTVKADSDRSKKVQ